MKVLHVIPTLSDGGAEKFVADLVRHEIRLGVDARACVFRKGSVDALWCKDLPPAIELDFQPGTGVQGRLALMRLVKQVRDVIQRARPDILHTHLWPACRIVARATRRLSVRQVWHVHDTQWWLEEKTLYGWLRRTQIRLMMRRRRPFLIAVSEAARQMAMHGLRLDEAQIVTVMNGVDTAVFQPADASRAREAGPVKIIMIAAFRPMKGYTHLVEAAKLLREAGAQFSMTLGGDASTEYGHGVREKVKQLRLEDTVRLVGQIRDVPSELRSHDIFVLCSDTEGLPLALLEAMACGLPVVVTRVGGMPEVVENGVTGFIVQPADSQELADRLRQLIESPELRIQMGQNAAIRVRKNHDFSECAGRIVEVYNRLIAQ
jgi:glycosyltransferase involved in cell wall biosynthesis